MAYPRWKKRVNYWRRIIFPSPAEVRFAALMGAKTYTFKKIRDPVPYSHHYPLSIIVPAGWYKDNFIEREINVAGYFLDFGNRRQRLAVEINGAQHDDIVKDQTRKEHLAKRHWYIKVWKASAVTPWSDDYDPNKVIAGTVKWFE